MYSVTWILLLIFKANAFKQNDYQLEFERLESVQYDKNYIKYLEIVTFKYNRTQAVANITAEFVKDIGNNLEMILQAYQFTSNEYRLFPMRFSFNVCQTLDNNDFGMKNLILHGNLTSCPIKKGRYFAWNWAPTASKYPPNIPNGHYKFELTTLTSSIEIAASNIYLTITRPMGRRH